jgi:hypothetical protein
MSVGASFPNAYFAFNRLPMLVRVRFAVGDFPIVMEAVGAIRLPALSSSAASARRAPLEAQVE